MWIFGYGSLIWNPGFEYADCKIGFIRGYVRRFWQGNDFHRGNPNKLGRVATLVEETKGITWGRAFKMGAETEAAMMYLNDREAKRGGYTTQVVDFYPRDSKEENILALIYVASPASRLYMGPAPLPQVATEIAEAVGRSGHNAEYLLRLADFMKEHLPEVWDEHLYHLEHLVRSRLKERKLSITDVMGDGRVAVSSDPEDDDRERTPTPPPSPKFASRVPSRKLRCVDI